MINSTYTKGVGFLHYLSLAFLLLFLSNQNLTAQCDPQPVSSEPVEVEINDNGNLIVRHVHFIDKNDCNASDTSDFTTELYHNNILISFHPMGDTWRARVNNACYLVGQLIEARVSYDGMQPEVFIVDALVLNRTLPMIMCENDTTFCNDPKAQIGGDPVDPPVAMMTCDGPEINPQFMGAWPVLLDACNGDFSHYIVRSWRAENKNGPVTCNDTVFIWNFDLEDMNAFFCPEGVDTLYCTDLHPDDYTNEGAPKPELTATPFYVTPNNDTFSFWPSSSLCKLAIGYEDDIWEICAGEKIVKRTWTLKTSSQACLMEVTCVDTILVLDTLAPKLSFDTSQLAFAEHPTLGLVGEYLTDTLRSGSHDCSGEGYIPYASVEETCSDVSTLQVSVVSISGGFSTQYGANEKPDLYVSNVPAGKHIVVYKIFDDCWNLAMDTVVLVVKDQTPATAICHDALNLTLLNVDDYTFMKAESIDAESYDNCGSIYIYARRVDWETACDYPDSTSEIRAFYDDFYEWVVNDSYCGASTVPYGFATKVPFCCEDVGKSIKVELIVIDNYCNIDRCWGMVNVEDKLGPALIRSLADDTITCDAYATFYEDIISQSDTMAIREAFGEYVFDPAEANTWALKDITCDMSDTVESIYQDGILQDNCASEIREAYSLNTSDCLTGYFERKFITTIGGHNGPEDLVIDVQHIYIKRCEMESLNMHLPYKDTIVYACGYTYNAAGNVDIETEGPDLGTLPNCINIGIGYFDKVFDIVSGPGCVKVLRTWCILDWCQVESSLNMSWEAISHLNGVVNMYQTIKIVDTVAPTIEVISAQTDINTINCTSKISSEVAVTDSSCGIVNISTSWELFDDQNVKLAEGNGTVATPDIELGPGEYSILWEAEDPCGNIGKLVEPFTVSSSTTPGVSSKSAVTTELMGMDTTGDNIPDLGMTVVWASEFDLSSTPPCGGDPNNIIFLLQRNINLDTIGPDADVSIKLTCDDYTANPTIIPVQFWVKDTVNNTADYVMVSIILQDNMNVCPVVVSNNVVNGVVRTESNELVNNVNIKAYTGLKETEAFTGKEGSYLLQLPGVQNTMVKPFKTDHPANGLSTIDLLKIQKHLLGKQLFTSPYQFIAADANKDGQVNPIDIVQLSKLLLGKIDELPNNDSWRFVDANYQFKRSSKALEEVFPEHIELKESNQSHEANFIGIKIGDLDGNVLAGRGRNSADRLMAHIPDQNLSIGENIIIPVSLSNPLKFEGIQFEILLDSRSVSFVELTGDQLNLNVDNFHVEHLPNGLISLKISWINAGNDQGSIQRLFDLTLGAKSGGKLSDAIAIGQSELLSEVYLSDGSSKEIVLDFKDKDNRELLVEQNRPNPFREHTNIDFTISSHQEVQLVITDLSGRSLLRKKGQYASGKHSFMVQKDGLPNGMLLYTIKTNTDAVTKRMTVMN